jgi:hypothetical protein
MKRRDEFDCVEMKRRIQAELGKEERGLSADSRNREVQRRGLADPVLGPWITELFAAKERRQPHACVAESLVEYGKGKK